MSKPLTPRLEFQLRSSALKDSDIITLPPVAPKASQPSLALTATLMLPCEPRFLIRLVDDSNGQSRWTTPEAARDAEMATRIFPPYHRSGRSVQSAFEAMAAHQPATRSVQHDLRRQAEAQRRAEREWTRPAYVVADAANGTAYLQSTMPSSPGIVHSDREEHVDADSDGEEENAPQGAQQEGEEDEGSEDDDAAAEIDPDSMPSVGASCQRCIEKKTRCDRRRPCQFCLRDGIAEGGCFLPRGSDSPDATSTAAQPISQQPADLLAANSVNPIASGTRGPGRNKKKRTELRNIPSPPPAPAPAPATASGFLSPANAANVSSFAAPAQPAPPVLVAPTASSTIATSEPARSKGGRKRKLTSPRPPLRNFPTDAEKKRLDEWLERHKND